MGQYQFIILYVDIEIEFSDGELFFPNIPTSEPSTVGAVYLSGQTLMVSNGPTPIPEPKNPTPSPSGPSIDWKEYGQNVQDGVTFEEKTITYNPSRTMWMWVVKKYEKGILVSVREGVWHKRNIFHKLAFNKAS